MLASAPPAGLTAWQHVLQQQRRSRLHPPAWLAQHYALHGRDSLRPCCCSAQQELTAEEALLDRFWQARGVVDDSLRLRLVAAGLQDQCSPGGSWQGPSGNAGGAPALPGLDAAWQLVQQGACPPQVALVSQRLLRLRQLLGGQDDVNVVGMLLREPRLLAASDATIMGCLMSMRVMAGAEGVDVVRLVEAHPSLLLLGGDGLASEETAAKRLQAWQHGLASDSDSEWARRHEELAAYQRQHGDAHVGFRDGDDVELSRWAAKQRGDQQAGSLAPERAAALAALGFEFDADAAEWRRWFSELASSQEQSGVPTTLASGTAFLLNNWCSVQRVMQRSRVLSPERQALLESVGFDWTGADALS